jgi:hypothetical protein
MNNNDDNNNLPFTSSLYQPRTTFGFQVVIFPKSSQIGLFNVKVSMVAINIPSFLMLCTRHILFSYGKRVCRPWMKPWMNL